MRGVSYGGNALDTLDEGDPITFWVPTIINYADHANGAKVCVCVCV